MLEKLRKEHTPIMKAAVLMTKIPALFTFRAGISFLISPVVRRTILFNFPEETFGVSGSQCSELCHVHVQH